MIACTAYAPQFPALVGGRWASGQAYMDMGVKRQQPLKAGIQLNMLRVDVKPLQVSFWTSKVVAKPG